MKPHIVTACRVFGIHLMYLSILASAAAACLPLVPVCLVAVPAALQLLAQVRRCVSVSILDTISQRIHGGFEWCAVKSPNVLLQGRSISAIMLLVLHVLAYYVGDAIIMAEV